METDTMRDYEAEMRQSHKESDLLIFLDRGLAQKLRKQGYCLRSLKVTYDRNWCKVMLAVFNEDRQAVVCFRSSPDLEGVLTALRKDIRSKSVTWYPDRYYKSPLLKKYREL